jgi:Tfp pilus assembly protein FimT
MIHGRRSRAGSARGGFSLAELAVSLLFITLLATASIWAFFTRSEVTLENAAELLVDDLHVAQSRALFLRTPVEVHFDEDRCGYRLTDRTGRTSGIPELDLVGRRYDVDAVFEGVRVHSIEGSIGRSVHFDARGATARDVWITLAYRGETRTVQVDPVAGVALVVDAASN